MPGRPGRWTPVLGTAAFVIAAAWVTTGPLDPDGRAAASVAATPVDVVQSPASAPPSALFLGTSGALTPSRDPAPSTRVIITTGGVVLPVLATKTRSWIVRAPCGGSTTLMAGVAADLVDVVDVVLDPGHGGPTEAGAVGPNGVVEADVNLAVARIAATKLEAAGYRAILTRYGDFRVPIVSRAAIADALDVPLVSIHHNAGQAGASATPGTEVIYPQDDARSRRLAGLIWEESMAQLGRFAGDWVAGGDAGATYRLGTDGDDFYGIVREPRSVAVLAEMSYISHSTEAALLSSGEFIDAEAAAIAQGIQRWLDSDAVGSGFVEPSYRLSDTGGGGGGSSDCVDPSFD